MLEPQIDYSAMRHQPPVAVMAIWGEGLTSPLPVLSYGFLNEAIASTLALLSDFEDARFRQINYKLLNCIGLWFLAMESGISTVSKVLSLTREVNVFKNLHDKFSKLPSVVGCTILPTAEQSSEFQEFCCFRNSTFHDLYYERIGTQYLKTFFSKVPAYANEIDMIEAARVSINSLNFYKYAIQGVSLLEANTDVVKTYRETILPKFQGILANKNYKQVHFRDLDTEVSPPLTQSVYAPVIKY